AALYVAPLARSISHLSTAATRAPNPKSVALAPAPPRGPPLRRRSHTPPPRRSSGRAALQLRLNARSLLGPFFSDPDAHNDSSPDSASTSPPRPRRRSPAPRIRPLNPLGEHPRIPRLRLRHSN